MESFLAYLDDDEDGIIQISTLLRIFKRENMYDFISENDVEDILLFMGKNDGVSVVVLLNMLENKNDNNSNNSNKSKKYGEESKNNDNDDDDNDDDSDKENGKKMQITTVEYDFSSDPETRLLEKKLRALGRTLCKKGIDIEGMFRTYDLRQTGMVRRTEFVEIMSKIGLSILEQGKALDDAGKQISSLESSSGSGPSSSDDRRLQLMQVRRLKGTDNGYVKNATTAARNLIMNGGEMRMNQGRGQGQGQGDFKVRYF